MACRRQRR